MSPVYRHKVTGRQAKATKGSKRDALMAADTEAWEAVKAPAKAPEAKPKADPPKGTGKS